MDHSLPLHHAIDVTSEFLSIVDHGNVVPDIQRVKLIAKQQCLIGGRRVQKSVETPLLANQTDFE